MGLIERKGVRAEIRVAGKWIDFRSMVDRFPFFTRRILAGIGVEGVKDLYDHIKNCGINYNAAGFNSLGIPLTGAEVNYYRGNQYYNRRRIRVSYKHFTSGRRMISFSVDKNGRFVQIKSFPLNVLTSVGNPRSSKRFRGKKIMMDFEQAFGPQVMRIASDKIDAIFEEQWVYNGSEVEVEKNLRGVFSRGENLFTGHERIRSPLGLHGRSRVSK